MTAGRARRIADLLQLHFEELAFLWGQRREALTSRRHTLREYAELNERIEAHLQGLLVAAPDELQSMLEPALAGIDRDEVFAAAYALLRLDAPAAVQAVLSAFPQARGAALLGLRDALGLAPHAGFAATLQTALEEAPPATAVAAAVELANHRLLDGHSPRLGQLLLDADPALCEPAWRAALLADARAPQTALVRPYNHALTHAAAPVRCAGWATAAWTGQARAMPLLRKHAAGGDIPAMHWLAVLGGEEDVALLLQVAPTALEDPAARCSLLARTGHPTVLTTLLQWMDTDDIALAVAAGEGFGRITGADIRGARGTLPVAEDADDFTREMAPDVWLPNVPKARALMDRHGTDWAAGQRWCKGFRVDGEVGRDLLVQLDLEARWEVAARAALAGGAVSNPPPIH